MLIGVCLKTTCMVVVWFSERRIEFNSAAMARRDHRDPSTLVSKQLLPHLLALSKIKNIVNKDDDRVDSWSFG